MGRGREIKEAEDQKTYFAYFSMLSGALQERPAVGSVPAIAPVSWDR